MQRLMREPLVWFVLLGCLLFAANEWRAGGVAETITVDDRSLAQYVARTQGYRDVDSAATWLDGISIERYDDVVAAFVLEEALYREAMRRRLDRGDLVVRSRMVTRLAQQQREVAAREPLSTAAVAAFFRDNRGRYPSDVEFESVEAAVLEDALARHTADSIRAANEALVATFTVNRDGLARSRQ